MGGVLIEYLKMGVPKSLEPAHFLKDMVKKWAELAIHLLNIPKFGEKLNKKGHAHSEYLKFSKITLNQSLLCTDNIFTNLRVGGVSRLGSAHFSDIFY